MAGEGAKRRLTPLVFHTVSDVPAIRASNSRASAFRTPDPHFFPTAVLKRTTASAMETAMRWR